MTSRLIKSDSEFISKMSLMQQKQFFGSFLDNLKELYGAENIVSAVVHMDEKTPHMHVCSVPLIAGKLSAKTIFDRKGLRNLQEELSKHLQSKGFDFKRGEKQIVISILILMSIKRIRSRSLLIELIEYKKTLVENMKR